MTATTPSQGGLKQWAEMVARSKPLAVAEWMLLAILLALFALKGFMPAWRTLNTDFPNYYVAAVLHHKGIPLDRVYEWTWFQRQKDHLGVEQPLVGFMPNPPICALPMLPLASLPALAAKRVWLTLNIAFLLFALWVLHRVTRLSCRRILLISFLCITPLQANFVCGQYYVLILALICGAYYASISNHRLCCGLVLSVAASLKLFPALFLILFVRRRNWKSAIGLVLGGAVIMAASVAIFGWEVHRVWFTEVLPRASHGDIIDPYTLQWASFSALWHKLFLFEPLLNPSPFFNSGLLYTVAQSITPVLLILGYLVSFDNDRTDNNNALDWAAFVSVILLLSSMPSSYHYCVLIFTAVVAIDIALEEPARAAAPTLLLVFAIICSPAPAFLGKSLSLRRIMGNFALYAWLLHIAKSGRRIRVERKWLGGAAFVTIVLAFSYGNSVTNRVEDFARRVNFAMKGYSANSPTPVGAEIAFTSMVDKGYDAVTVRNGTSRNLPLAGDGLAVAGSSQTPVAYLEESTEQSSIMRLPLSSQVDLPADLVAPGERPSVSSNGKWLAFLREDRASTSVWLSATESSDPPQPVALIQQLVDLSVTDGGDLIAAVGPVSHPHLILLRKDSSTVEPLNEIIGAVRYAAISPDGTRLAFSRLVNGSWHLVVRELATRTEQQLTHASCNAISPSWESSKVLLYATDCGRGLGLSALARVAVPNL